MYFSYKNAFHIKGVIILGKGIVVRHHRKCKNLEWHCLSAYRSNGGQVIVVNRCGGHEGYDWGD